MYNNKQISKINNSPTFSISSEAFASDLIGNLEEICVRCCNSFMNKWIVCTFS